MSIRNCNKNNIVKIIFLGLSIENRNRGVIFRNLNNEEVLNEIVLHLFSKKGIQVFEGLTKLQHKATNRSQRLRMEMRGKRCYNQEANGERYRLRQARKGPDSKPSTRQDSTSE